MKLSHVALACSSEQRADAFYQGVLKLKKMKSFLLPRELAKKIFETDRECQVVVYGNSRFAVEVFLTSLSVGREPGFEHICIAVENIEEFVKRCEAMQVKVNRVSKEDRLLTFVKDYDGNIFEVKEMVSGE